jgi:ribokinase
VAFCSEELEIKQRKPKIVVVGSSNMELVVKAPRIPAIGETVLGEDFIMTPGGKGANQAVAAAKLGAEVYFVAKLGDDIFSCIARTLGKLLGLLSSREYF